MTRLHPGRRLSAAASILLGLCFPLAGHADHGPCPKGKGIFLILSESDESREVWMYKDPEGFDDLGTAKVSAFKSCPEVLEVNKDYQTILLHYKENMDVWVMRSGLRLSDDAGATCLTEDNESGTMGVRTMGEGCKQ